MCGKVLNREDHILAGVGPLRKQLVQFRTDHRGDDPVIRDVSQRGVADQVPAAQIVATLNGARSMSLRKAVADLTGRPGASPQHRNRTLRC
ncbi:MAG TPA: hypothetical protein VIM40_11695 [Arthrobacter sp.]